MAGSTCISIAIDVSSISECKAEPSVVTVQLLTLHLLHLTTVNCPISCRWNSLHTTSIGESSTSVENLTSLTLQWMCNSRRASPLNKNRPWVSEKLLHQTWHIIDHFGLQTSLYRQSLALVLTTQNKQKTNKRKHIFKKHEKHKRNKLALSKKNKNLKLIHYKPSNNK